LRNLFFHDPKPEIAGKSKSITHSRIITQLKENTMNRHVGLITGILVIVMWTVFFSGPVAAEEKTKASLAYQAAVEGLPDMLKGIKGRAMDYGFSSEADLDRATVGKTALVMYSFKEEQDITFTESFRFPVLVDNQPVAMLDVHKPGDAYRAGAIGAADFAKEIFDLSGGGGSQTGLSLVNVLRSYEVKGDFRIMGPVDAPNPELKPFESGKIALESENAALGMQAPMSATATLTLGELKALIKALPGDN
jgi:hypothetical protein